MRVDGNNEAGLLYLYRHGYLAADSAIETAPRRAVVLLTVEPRSLGLRGNTPG